MDATLPFRWRRSPSHGKCSRRFCGSLRNYGRSHHQHQRETLDGHALKSNRREECVLMPAKMSRSAPRPPFRLREVSIAVRTLRLSCRKAGKAPIFTPVRESSGESRLKRAHLAFPARMIGSFAREIISAVVNLRGAREIGLSKLLPDVSKLSAPPSSLIPVDQLFALKLRRQRSSTPSSAGSRGRTFSVRSARLRYAP